MAQMMAMAGFFGFVAWEDGEPLGFVLALDLGGECEILALGVVPGRRRAGTGSALLAAVCEEVLSRGVHSVFLEVAADNAAARALYAVGGFVQIGRRPNYYRRPGGPVDALVLRRAIARAPFST
jgi:[ribosomal protein S18]-alanine N-acetyltransferase